MKQGRITPNGVVLYRHENATVVFLTEKGYDVELLPPLQQKGAKTPDIVMEGFRWEIKCPVGKSPNTIKRAFKVALRQSKYIIFDVRGSKMSDKVNVAKLLKEFNDIKSVKRLLIVTKKRELLDFSK